MRVLIAVALLMCVAGLTRPIEQEKAQPTALPTCYWSPETGPEPDACKNPLLRKFDLPAKEWDGPDKHAADTCGPPSYNPDGTPQMVACGGELIWEENHHVSCEDVAPDWKQRVLLDSADGKHHCYAFYLVGQKP